MILKVIELKKTLYAVLGIIIIILIVVSSSCSADIKAYSWRTKLVQGINTNDIDKVEGLLQKSGLDINGDGSSFLQFVFGSEVVSQTPFVAALYSNDLELLRMVLSYDGIVPFCEEENPIGYGGILIQIPELSFYGIGCLEQEQRNNNSCNEWIER